MDGPLEIEDQAEQSNANVVTTVFMEEDRLQERGVSIPSSLGEGPKRGGGGGEEEEDTEGVGGRGDGEKGVMGRGEEGEGRGETERVHGRGSERDKEEEKGEDQQIREEVREPERMPVAVVQEEIGEASITFEQVQTLSQT